MVGIIMWSEIRALRAGEVDKERPIPNIPLTQARKIVIQPLNFVTCLRSVNNDLFLK